MSAKKTRRLALLGIVIGIIVASIASDEIMLLQAKTQAQRDSARFYIGIVAVISSLTALLTFVGLIKTNPAWIGFVGGTAATVTMVNIIFLVIIPHILAWIQG